MTGALLQVGRVTRTYRLDRIEVRAVNDVKLSVEHGEFVALVGPSGSGKTTLLNLIGGLDQPDTGSVILAGVNMSRLPARDRARFRRRHIGFIFQSFNLIPVLTAEENAGFILELRGEDRRLIRKKVRALFEELGLAGKENRKPAELSGGEQQRVAVARALIGDPVLVLADEPTANLDSANADLLLTMMRKMNEKYGTTFLISTHDARVVAKARREIVLRDGRLIADRVLEEGSIPPSYLPEATPPAR
ncbi:MAG: ABC transporter ATP-binding protein [bacterium JZ-2024 1]